MDRQNWPIWIVLALLAVVVIVAIVLFTTVSNLGGGEQVARPEGALPLLPQVNVEIAENGAPTIMGISLEKIGNLLNRDMSPYYVPQDLVQQLTDANVQHMQAVVGGDGILLYANGKPLPYLALDDESRQSLGDLAAMFNVPNADTIQWVSDNVLSRAGLPVAIKLPVQSGAEEIPLKPKEELATVNVDEVRSAVTDRSLILYADVAVDANGVPTIGGMSLDALQEGLASSGLAVDLSAATLDPGLVSSLTAANVQHLQVETEPEGLYLYLNGKPLTRIAWDEERLQNAADLYEALDPQSPYLPLVRFLLPSVQPADVELTVNLPQQAGAQEFQPRPFIEGR